MRILHQSTRRGFTLIEIMVVVIVIAILAAVVIPNVVGRDEDARVSKARSDIANLSTAIEGFRLDMRRYPFEDEGLAILREPPSSEDAEMWKGPYVTKPIPNDPWSNPYRYYSPAGNDIDPYGIESLGNDGEVGGEDHARDINTWTNYDDPEAY